MSGHVHRGHGELTSRQHRDVRAAAVTQQEGVCHLEVRAAGPAVGESLLFRELERGSLEGGPGGGEVEAELECLRNDAGQAADAEAYDAHVPIPGALEHR